MIPSIINKINSWVFWRNFSFLVVILGAEIWLTCLIPEWRDYFYNVLQQLDKSEFLPAVFWGGLLLIGLGSVQGVKTWSRQRVSFEIRRAASKAFLKKWIYSDRTSKNYGIALTDTIKNSTDLLLDVLCEVFISAAIIVALIIQHWHSTDIIVAALVYTVLVSICAYLFNKPLINSDTQLQVAENRYRTSIGDVANGINNYTLKADWAHLASKFSYYINVLMGFTLFSRVKGALASIVPYFLLAGPYFNKDITLGGFMSGVATFELIVINATILVIVYPQITKAIASYKIAKEFYNDLKV